MRKNIIIFLFAFTAFGLIAFDLSLTLPALENIKKTTSQFQLEQARKIRDNIVASLSLLILAVQEKASLLSQTETIEQREAALLPLLKENVGLFQEAALIDQSGKEIFRTSVFGLLPLTETDYSKDKGFSAAKAGQAVFGSVFYLPDYHSAVFFYLPVGSSITKTQGILKILIDLHFIQTFVDENIFGENGFVYVVDNIGKTIAHPFLMKKAFLTRTIVRKVLEEKRVIDGLLKEDRYLNENNQEVFAVAAPLTEFRLNWGVIAEQLASGAFAAQNRIILQSFAFSIFIIIALYLLGYSFFSLNKSNILIRQERDKTEAIIFNLTDGLLMYDEKNAIVLVNPRAEEILKIKAQDILGKEIKSEFFKTEPKFFALSQAFFPSLAQAARQLNPEKEGYPKIHEITLRDPHNLILQTTTLPVYNPNKEVIGFLKIIRDITREKLIERTKSEFISIAAHQLRTPLSAIKWIFRMLIEGDIGKVTAEQLDFLKKGDESNERMIKLVSDLLDIARIEEGRFGYEFKEANLGDIISSAIKDIQLKVEEQSVRLILTLPKEKLPTVKVDVAHLTQAIQNLVDNAIRYSSPAGKVNISVEKANQYLKVTIKDEGIGIPKNQLDRVFTKFFRADNAVRLQTEGSGLGLYIVRNIIRRHGGEIKVESEEGKGSTFSFIIPTEEELIPKGEELPFEEFIRGF